MKTCYQYVFFILSLITLFASCSDDEKIEIEDKFEIFDNLSVFETQGGDQSITLITSDDWTAHTDQTWCKVTPSRGSLGTHSLTVTTDANPDVLERNATLIIESGANSKNITITQKQKNALLLSSSKKEISSKGGNIEIEVKSNIDFSFSIDASAVEWITPVSSKSLTSSFLRFNVKENANLEKRQGTITFFSGNKKENFTVYQDGSTPELILTQDTYDINAAGEEIKIELKSNFPYDIEMPEVDWIKRIEGRSLSTYTHYFKVLPNSNFENRTAQIKFKQQQSNLVKAVTINQFQKDIIFVSQTDFTVLAEGEIIALDLQANTSFKVKCSHPWIKQISRSKSLQNKTIEFKVDPNTSKDSRTGIITFYAGDLTQDVKITQDGLSGFVIEKPLTIFAAKKETQELIFTSLSDWTIRNNESWCTVTPNKGLNGKMTVSVTVEEIVGTPMRTDTLYLESGNICKKIPVVQQNQDELIIVTPDFKMSNHDSIITVKLRAAYDVTFQIDDKYKKWIQPLDSRTLVDRELKFQIAKNNDVLERIGKIKFFNGDKGQELTITQEGVGMQIHYEPEKVEISAAKNQFDIIVTSNFKYKVWHPEVDWIRQISSETLPSDDPSISKTKFRYEVDENNGLDMRIVYVYFLNTEYVSEFGQIETNLVRVFQKSKHAINVPQSKYHVTADEQELNFNVTSNVKYDVLTSKPWIKKISETKVTDETVTLGFKIDKNTSLDDRAAQITLAYGTNKKYIDVIQEGFKDYGIMVIDSLKPFNTAGETQTLKFRASENWTASTDASWCTISPESGTSGEQTMKVTATANPDTEERKATLVFKCGRHHVQLTLVQQQKDLIEVEKELYNLAWNTTQFNLGVKSNCQYSVNVSETGGWIKKTDETKAIVENTIPFVLQKNETDTLREAIITLQYKDLIKKVKVVQNHLDSLTISTPSAQLSNTKDTLIKVKLVSSSKVTYKINQFDQTWIIPKETDRGLTYPEFEFLIKKNIILDRQGLITFTNGKKSINYHVNQKGQGLQMQLSTEKVDINCRDSVFDATVSSNYNYELKYTGDWVKELSSEVISEKDAEVTVTKYRFAVSANPLAEDRSMDISFKNTEYVTELGEVVHNIHVNQEGKDDIRIPQPTYNVKAKGEELTIPVESNVDFKVSTSDTWIKYTPATRSAFTKKELRFVIENNTVTEKREGTITLASPLCTKTITISQEAFDDYGIRINNSLTEFSDKGGKQQLSFGTSRDWVAIVTDQTWCHIPSNNGKANDNNILDITVDANPGFESRTTDFIINSNGKQETIKVTQKGMERIIELPQSSFNVDADTTELSVSVNANCEYKVQSNVPWITLKPATKDLNASRIVFILEVNPDSTERTGTVDIISESLKKTITVIQAAHTETNPDAGTDPDSGTDNQPGGDSQPGTEGGQTQA